MRGQKEGFQGEFRLISDEFEDGEFKETLPFSDLNRWVEDKDFLFVASQKLKIWKRLGNIRQLSFLSYVGSKPEEMYFTGYAHDRLDHSLGVGLTAGEIGRRNNLDDLSVRYLEVSGLLHDIGMPALGDAAKFVDPQNLNEEEHWTEAIDEEGETFLKDERLDEEKIAEIIKNHGLKGKIIDKTDRLVYTMKDLSNVIGIPSSKINVSPYLIEIRYPLSHYPDIGNIYKDIEVDIRRDEVFFADPDRLGVFLLLRSLMHKHLYLDPTSQGRDLFIANLISPLYSTDGTKPFSPQILRQMTDQQALDVLAKNYKFPRLNGDWLYTNLTNWHPKYERCQSEKEAKIKAVEIGKKFLVLGTKQCRGFDTGKSYLTLYNNEIVPFSEADPGMTWQLDDIEKDTEGFFVFYTDISDDSPINELLKTIYNL